MAPGSRLFRAEPSGAILGAMLHEGGGLAAEHIARVLKVSRGAARRHTTHAELRAAILKGLPYASLEALVSQFHIARKDLAALLRVPPRTLARRKRARRFEADESDRLFRVGRIAAQAEHVLGSREKASAWLREPNRALGGAVPLRQLDTDLGAREVEDVLLRIAHGVYS